MQYPICSLGLYNSINKMMIHNNNFGRKYFDTFGIFYLKNVEIKSFDVNLMTSLKTGTNFFVKSENLLMVFDAGDIIHLS